MRSYAGRIRSYAPCIRSPDLRAHWRHQMSRQWTMTCQLCVVWRWVAADSNRAECDSAVETRYHLLTALHVVQWRPVDVLQGLSHHRLAVGVLAISDHRNVLALLTLCDDTCWHYNSTVVWSANVRQHNWHVIPIVQIGVNFVRDCNPSSCRFTTCLSK